MNQETHEILKELAKEAVSILNLKEEWYCQIYSDLLVWPSRTSAWLDETELNQWLKTPLDLIRFITRMDSRSFRLIRCAKESLISTLELQMLTPKQFDSWYASHRGQS